MLAAVVEAEQLLLGVLEFAHQLRLVPREVANAVVEADEDVDYLEEDDLLPALELGELEGPVESLQLGDLLTDS